MVSGSVRSLLVPAVAMATAGAIALSPVVIAPPAVTLAQPTAQLPSVHIADIQLAGIGVDIYEAIQPWVEYGVDLAMWATLWIPPVSSQIGVLYFAGLNPLVETTVFALADVVSNPLNFFGILGAYAWDLAGVGLGFINAELAWAGLPSFPPLPPLPPWPFAAADSSAAALASVRTARTPRAAAAVSLPAPVDEVVGEVTEVAVPVVDEAPDLAAPDLAAVTSEVAATSAPAEPVRGELRRSARAAVSSVRQTARAAAADVAAAAEQAVAEVTATVDAATGEARSTARAARGAVTKAAQAASSATPD
jgi:hypothetical protein